MSKVAKTVAIVAAVVALAATGVGLVMGGAAFAATFGVAAGTVAAIAGAVSTAASLIAQATMKPPDMKGTISQVAIGKNLPVPIMLGRTYSGGMQIYDKSANGPDNYDRTQIMIISGAGPINAFEALQADYTTITFGGSDWNTSRKAAALEFYGKGGGYLWLNTRRGLNPETALTAFAGREAFAEWGADYKLSGYAAYSVTMEFDEAGRRWASGIPQWGIIGEGVSVYDPRQDSTYPGGVGAQRWDDEDTWGYGAAGVGTVAPGENPALQALTYARGWFRNDVKIAGVGFDEASIDVAQFIELANVCDANGWTAGGVIYEGPELSKWDNLKRILQAAAAEPVWAGGQLGLRISAPKTSLTTITLVDLADGEISVQAMKAWRDKFNTIVPRVRLEDQKWEYTQIGEVTDETYLAEDGEAKSKEVQFDLCQDKDQGAELAAYELVNSREFGPIQLPCKPHLMAFRPGEAVTVDIAEAGLDSQLCVITGRQRDPQTGVVVFTLESETTAKHDFALGRTGTAPPTPTIVPPEDIDEAVAGDTLPPPAPATVDLVEWNDRLVMRTDPIGRAKSYRWRFYLSDGVTLKREITTAIPQVEYTKAQAHADGVSRSYKVEVAGVNDVGTGTALMSATQTKAAPAAPTAVAFADGTSTSTVSGTASASTSTTGYLVAWSTVSGFDPMTQGSSMLAGGFPAYTPQLPAAAYYGKAAAYDLWTAQPDTLNYSAQDAFTITPGGGGDVAGGDGGGGSIGGGGHGGVHDY